MEIWNKIYPKDDNPARIENLLKKIGDGLESETDRVLSFKITPTHDIDKKLIYFYDFDITYFHQGAEHKYRLYSIQYAPFDSENRMRLKTYLLNGTISDDCDEFGDISVAIERECMSDGMGNVIGRIIHLINSNNNE